jgi:hypothetical protein
LVRAFLSWQLAVVQFTGDVTRHRSVGRTARATEIAKAFFWVKRLTQKNFRAGSNPAAARRAETHGGDRADFSSKNE